MSFWDTYDDRPVEVKPGHEHLVPREAPNPSPRAHGPAPLVDQCSPQPCSQNDTTGVCDWCGIASDDVLLGVCDDCVQN